MTNANSRQEEDFSLGAYVRVLLRGWRVIAISLIATLVIGIVFSVLQPRTFESEAILAAEAQKYTWRLDTNFQTVTEDLRLDRRTDYNVLITDSTLGAELARTVIKTLGDQLPEELRHASVLHKAVNVRNGSGRLVYLTVTASNPALAQKLAEAWSQAWIEATNNRFGQGADEAKFATELTGAEAELQTANDELQAFQGRTGLALEMGGNLASLDDGSLAAGMPLLQQQLVLNNSSLADYRIALARVRMLEDEVNKAKAGTISYETLPLEVLDTPLLVTRGQLTRAKVDAMSGDLDALLSALTVEEGSLATTVGRLEAETESIQTEYASLLQQQQALVRRQGLASLHFRLVEVAMMFLLPMLAMALAVPPKRSSSSLGVFVSIILVVAYHKVNEYGQDVSSLGRIDPTIALWGPFFVFAALIMWMYWRLAYVPGGQPLGALETAFAKATKVVSKLFASRHGHHHAHPVSDGSDDDSHRTSHAA